MSINFFIFSLGFLVCSNICSGQICDSIDGIWYNQHGSEIIFEDDGNELTGELRTGVERTPGSAGRHFSVLTGFSRLEKSGLVGFSAVFNQGGSVTTWLGHCMKCNNLEMLRTTWLLKKDSTCDGEWMSTLINEDVFQRTETVDGPRKLKDLHVPKRNSSWIPNEVESAFENNTPVDSKINGTWYADDGSVLELSVNRSEKKGNIKGVYRSIDSKVSNFIGLSDVKSTEIFGLTGTSEDSKSADAWVGQYHVCKGIEVLDTSRLLSDDSKYCEKNSKYIVNYRHTRFTRTKNTRSNNSQNWKFRTMFSEFGTKVSGFFTKLFN